MKRRVRKIANFFAFNLLFFALYLNFIHQDKQGTTSVMPVASTEQPAAFSGTIVLVDNPVQSANQATMPSAIEVTATKEEKTN